MRKVNMAQNNNVNCVCGQDSVSRSTVVDALCSNAQGHRKWLHPLQHSQHQLTHRACQTIRRTLVLEENREKNFETKNEVKYLITSFKAESCSKPGKLHSDCKTHPHFPPKFGVSASYSLKNMVMRSPTCFKSSKTIKSLEEVTDFKQIASLLT